jgi:hypothetical protein
MIEIRSYRNVFDLERRIYRIDRLRLNPAGVPLRGIAYFLAALAAALLVRAMPLVGLLAQALPWYLFELGIPGVLAALLTLIKVEGRPFHLAARALLRFGIGSRELAGLRTCARVRGRWLPDQLLLLADGSDSHMRPMRYVGPGAVLVSVAHVRAVWPEGFLRKLVRRPDVTLTALEGKPRPACGQVIALSRGARLEVRR